MSMRVVLDDVLSPGHGLESVAKQLGVSVAGNELRLPPGMGEGTVTNVPVLDGVCLSCMRFRFDDAVVIERRGTGASSQVPVIFYSDKWSGEQRIGGESLRVGRDTPNGVFLPSPHISTSWTIPGGMWFFFVNLLFDIGTLAAMAERNGSAFLLGLLRSGEPFYVFEPLQPAMEHAVRAMQEALEAGGKGRELQLQHLSLRLFSLLFERLEARSDPGPGAPVDSDTARKMFAARALIGSSLPERVPVTALATEAGMCVSKFQRCFRLVFGMTPSEYALAEKMRLAGDMLAGGDRTASEVGFHLGYTNLAHFAKSFRKAHGVNPSEYRRRLRAAAAARPRRAPGTAKEERP